MHEECANTESLGSSQLLRTDELLDAYWGQIGSRDSRTLPGIFSYEIDEASACVAQQPSPDEGFATTTTTRSRLNILMVQDTVKPRGFSASTPGCASRQVTTQQAPSASNGCKWAAGMLARRVCNLAATVP